MLEMQLNYYLDLQHLLHSLIFDERLLLIRDCKYDSFSLYLNLHGLFLKTLFYLIKLLLFSRKLFKDSKPSTSLRMYTILFMILTILMLKQLIFNQIFQVDRG